MEGLLDASTAGPYICTFLADLESISGRENARCILNWPASIQRWIMEYE